MVDLYRCPCGFEGDHEAALEHRRGWRTRPECRGRLKKVRSSKAGSSAAPPPITQPSPAFQWPQQDSDDFSLAVGIVGAIHRAARRQGFQGDDEQFFTQTYVQHVQKCQGRQLPPQPWEMDDALTAVLDHFSRCDPYRIQVIAKGRVPWWWP